MYILLFTYYYLKTTFINPSKGDFAEMMSLTSNYKIEGKKTNTYQNYFLLSTGNALSLFSWF